MTISSVLIVKLGAVGDCVHTLYALRALRLAFPKAKIGWVVEGKSAGVVKGHPDLDEVIVFPRKEISAALKAGKIGDAIGAYRRFVKDLRGVKYETAVDFQNLFKSGFAARASGARQRIGFRRLREANFLFTNRWIKPYPGARHAIEKYFSLLRPLGIDKIPDDVHIHVPDEKKEAVDLFWRENNLHKKRVVAVNPEASWPNKKLGADKYARAIDELAAQSIQSVIIWGPKEEQSAQSLRGACRAKPLLAPPTDIKELYYLLSRCDAYLGNDSGPMHMAAAAGIGVAGVFGPSDPDRVGPWTERGIVVSSEALCSPCWKRKCPMPGVYCMDKITSTQLVKAVHDVLEGA